MLVKADIGIIGAGPAGLAAACEAARSQARVVVIDENSTPGGQLIKQIHKFFGSSSHGAGIRGIDLAVKLVEEAKSLGVEIISNAVVHAVLREGKEVEFHDDQACHSLVAERLIVAAGASENALAFPGWTLPGVMTAGALQTMMNIHRVLPARRILMVGAGNVGLIVSYQAIQAGAQIVAVLEAEPHIGGYAVHAAKLERLGVPLLTRTTIARVSGDEKVRWAEVISLSEDRQIACGSKRRIETDLVCLAVGLTPLVELPAMAGCRLQYVPELGGLVPWHDENMRTTLANIYIAGDISGIEEASTAIEQGRLAGISAAESLGFIEHEAAEVQRKKILTSLGQLRSGSKGARVALAKARLTGSERFVPVKQMETQGPSFSDIAKICNHAVAIIECPECIPCNPCVKACPFGAISMDGGISGLPVLSVDKCRGCGVCIPHCPGQAIYVLNKNHATDTASIIIPYEFNPRPTVGETVAVTNRKGDIVCQGRVAEVRVAPSFDRTLVLVVEFPIEYADTARYIRRDSCGQVG